jgi:hypothetical protein
MSRDRLHVHLGKVCSDGEPLRVHRYDRAGRWVEFTRECDHEADGGQWPMTDATFVFELRFEQLRDWELALLDRALAAQAAPLALHESGIYLAASRARVLEYVPGTKADGSDYVLSTEHRCEACDGWGRASLRQVEHDCLECGGRGVVVRDEHALGAEDFDALEGWALTHGYLVEHRDSATAILRGRAQAPTLPAIAHAGRTVAA